MHRLAALCLLVSACGPTYDVPVGASPTPAPSRAPATALVVASPAPDGAARTQRDFLRVAKRIERVGEAFCRQQVANAPSDYCDYRITLNTDPKMPPNAYQTLSKDGRPLVVLGSNLLAEMRSDDELAFVLSHEMSHHIAGHIAKQQQQQMLGGLLGAGIIAAAGNIYGMPATDQAIQQGMDVGAYIGARTYSQSYELEADTLGAYVTARAGYSPERGAAIFGRPSLANPGGPPILATHPGSTQRQATVAQVAAEIRRQQALGQIPTP